MGRRPTEEYLDAASCYIYAARYSKAKQLPQPMTAWLRDQSAYWPWPEGLWQPSDEVVPNLRKAIEFLERQIEIEESL